MHSSRIIAHLISLQNDETLEYNLETITQRLRDDILEVGSKTEDNIACVQQIEYGLVPSPWLGHSSKFGVKIRDKKMLLSEIFNATEGSEIPQQVKELIPSITNQDWDAAFRLATLIFIELEISATRSTK